MSLKEKNPAPKAKDRSETVVRKKDKRKGLTKILSQISTEGDGNFLFTSQQIDAILDLTLKNGKPFITLESEYTYEFIGGCEKFKREGDDISELIVITQDQLNQGNYNYVNNAPWFEKERKIYQEELKRAKTKVVVKKGIFKCPNCVREKREPNNTETDIYSTRSGDEPLTVHNRCNTCGYSWKF